MKKILFYVLMLFTLISCEEFDYGYTSNQIAYNKAFTNEFGQVDPNHTFGFIDQPILNYTPAQTRVVNTESNLWGDPNYYALNVPADVTEAEAKWVYNWFATNQNPQGQAIHWSDFFIQYVSAYNEVNNTTKRNMDQLGYEGIITDWEHVNDFNVTTHTTKYVYNAGTENWTYRASHSNTYQYNKYVIQFLSFTAEDGNHYEGWYVGFDYESLKWEGDGSLESRSEYADGYYNDWIVKVTPGTHLGYPISVRVMCEDLGNSFDWDFNDVVFDVSFVGIDQYEYWPVAKYRKYRATIILRAVGGTLPIFVGTSDERFEAHALLGDGSMTPIIHPSAPVIYTVELNESDLTPGKNTLNAKNIPIYVRGQYATYQIQSSDIPQKFACPDNVDWTEECQNICDKYEAFPLWIKNEDMGNAEDVWNLNPLQ